MIRRPARQVEESGQQDNQFREEQTHQQLRSEGPRRLLGGPGWGGGHRGRVRRAGVMATAAPAQGYPRVAA